MKKLFFSRPDFISEQYCQVCGGFSWYDFVTAMPSMVFVITSWKANGRANARLHAWSSFVGAGPDDFVCLLNKIPRDGHTYRSIKETGACVLNFPSLDIYGRCIKTIGNNQFDADEITAAGLTPEPAARVNAPQIKECFLNIECELLWEHELMDGSSDMTVALKAVAMTMDSEHYDQHKLGRYGETGYLYQIDQPTHPEAGEVTPLTNGSIQPCAPIPWNTK